MPGMNSFQDLRNRGFVYQATDEAATIPLLEKEKVCFYAGFDPTADSLHAGHLLPVMAMRRLQQAGHIPIVLVGGATALVGDPSGKQEARPILTKEEVAANAQALRKQLGRFIALDDGKAVFVNNADWFMDLLYIDFLREIGSRFSVNRMLAAESVKLRLETGLSFLEFNYMLLQAYDFHVLNKKYNCKLQLGGQDQWGNIVAGVELVRRISQNEVFGITFPLLTDSAGKKFGKTAGGAVWLDTARTSVFDYYQFWRNCEDADIAKLLFFFTSLPDDEIKMLSSLDTPGLNRAKEILAYEATALAHGEAEAAKAYLGACSKFGYSDPEGKIKTSSGVVKIRPDADAGLSDLPTFKIALSDFPEEGIWIIKLLTDAGLCSSNGEARRLLQGGGAYINDQRLSDLNYKVVKTDFNKNSMILKAGKKNVRRIVLE